MKKQTEFRPIYLPDGGEVKEGEKVYMVENTDVCSYPSKNQILSHSGKISGYLKEYIVAKVNHQENQRSFILRSDRGCEQTYYVKNNCLPDMFTCRKKAVEHLKIKEKTLHLDRIDKKISYLNSNIEQIKEKIEKFKNTKSLIIKNLKDIK